MTRDELVANVSREAVMRPAHVRQVFAIADRLETEEQEASEPPKPAKNGRKTKKSSK